MKRYLQDSNAILEKKNDIASGFLCVSLVKILVLIAGKKFQATFFMNIVM